MPKKSQRGARQLIPEPANSEMRMERDAALEYFLVQYEFRVVYSDGGVEDIIGVLGQRPVPVTLSESKEDGWNLLRDEAEVL